MPNPSESSHENILTKLYRSQVRRIFSGIYEGLLVTGEANTARSVLVCSSTPREGSTTVALGFAIAAAEERNRPVLLIDGNFHDPQICESFNSPELYGLGDLLAGKVEINGAVKRTAIRDLWVMGAGVLPPSHFESLEPPKFREFLNKLSKGYPFVVIDGPAINVFPESIMYASQVDRVFLVVHAGVTRVPVVSAALAKLAAAGCNKVDLVLNRRIFPIPPAIYKMI